MPQGIGYDPEAVRRFIVERGGRPTAQNANLARDAMHTRDVWGPGNPRYDALWSNIDPTLATGGVVQQALHTPADQNIPVAGPQRPTTQQQSFDDLRPQLNPTIPPEEAAANNDVFPWLEALLGGAAGGGLALYLINRLRNRGGGNVVPNQGLGLDAFRVGGPSGPGTPRLPGTQDPLQLLPPDDPHSQPPPDERLRLQPQDNPDVDILRPDQTGGEDARRGVTVDQLESMSDDELLRYIQERIRGSGASPDDVQRMFRQIQALIRGV